MNVLLTSVGRRSYLVRYFQDALQGRGRVVATNSVADAPGMQAADSAYVVPSAGKGDYIERILEICQKERIGLLCSLHDWEGPFLTENIEKFRENGVLATVSSPEIMKICLDKGKTAGFCQKNGILTPKCCGNLDEAVVRLENGELSFPVMIKPRRGQGSIELYQVESLRDLHLMWDWAGRRLEGYASNHLLMDAKGGGLLVQEVVPGVEYGLDVVNDLNGNFVCCFVKRKYAMRAGETDVAETVHDPSLEALGAKIGRTLRHVGVLDMDVMVDGRGAWVLEMNARFGGHYPFSHEAGANIPAALLAWAEGKEANPDWLRVQLGVRCCKDIALVRLSPK